MPFAYYEWLSEEQQAVYRASDRVRALRIHHPSELTGEVEQVRSALENAEPQRLVEALQRLADRLTERLHATPVRVALLETRPRASGGELHGLYTRSPELPPAICVWMRTAVHGRVVAFRTFLRTFLHELCHHLDSDLLGLPSSFHTEGFYQRETSLFHQLVPAPPRGRARPF